MIKTKKHLSFVSVNPSVILDNLRTVKLLKNYYIESDGTLRPFPAMTMLIQLQNPHSLYKIKDNTFLVCSNTNGYDRLYLIDTANATYRHLGVLGTSYNRTWFVGFGYKIFISNLYYTSCLNSEFKLERWEPPQTSSNKKTSFDYYIDEALISFPPCENLCVLGGRIFGNRFDRVWFTEPVNCMLCKEYNFLKFPVPVNVMVNYGNNIFLGTANSIHIIGIDNNNDITETKVANVGVLRYGAVSIGDVVIFINNDGVHIFKDGNVSTITRPSMDILINGEPYIVKLSDTLLLIGGDSFNITLRDSLLHSILQQEV